MQLGRTLLWVNAGLFIAFGVGFALAPAYFAGLFTGDVPSTTSAAIDMRATYGGLGIGVGIWLLLSQGQTRLGLQGLCAVLGAIAFGRALGLGIDGSANGFMLAFLASEIGMLLLAFYAMRRIRP